MWARLSPQATQGGSNPQQVGNTHRDFGTFFFPLVSAKPVKMALRQCLYSYISSCLCSVCKPAIAPLQVQSGQPETGRSRTARGVGKVRQPEGEERWDGRRGGRGVGVRGGAGGERR